MWIGHHVYDIWESMLVAASQKPKIYITKDLYMSPKGYYHISWYLELLTFDSEHIWNLQGINFFIILFGDLFIDHWPEIEKGQWCSKKMNILQHYVLQSISLKIFFFYHWHLSFISSCLIFRFFPLCSKISTMALKTVFLY